MDRILRTFVCGGNAQAAIMDTTDIVNRAIEIHSLSPKAAQILGGLLTCGAYLCSFLKTECGNVSLTVKAKNGDGAVSVSADSQLHVRGYADGACEQTLVGGDMTVVRDDGYFRPFVGACPIESDDVSDILSEYFFQSEQIPVYSYIKVDIDKDGKCAFAGGIVVQMMPGASADDEACAAELVENLRLSGAGNLVKAAKEGLFGGEIIAEAFPEYKCNCSEEKIRGVLASVGKTELLNICDEIGEVKVHCHYCNKDYVYKKKNIEEIF